jgi:hypothetical protein
MRDSGIISVRDSRVLTMGARSGMADSVMSEVANRSERNVPCCDHIGHYRNHSAFSHAAFDEHHDDDRLTL